MFDYFMSISRLDFMLETKKGKTMQETKQIDKQKNPFNLIEAPELIFI